MTTKDFLKIDIDVIFRYLRKYLSFWKNLCCATIVTAIFSLRWVNCLPFSGRMPILDNRDVFEVWGRYVMWAREPFHFPMVGVIHSLAFPFKTANISHGPIALFAIFFKALSKIYEPFASFYYPVFAEMVFVFLTAFFAVLLLDEFRVKSFWLKMFGAVLVGLSFPLLYRSLSLSFEVGYFPGYLIFAYCYIRAYKKPCLKTVILLSLVFPFAVSVDDYLLLGISFMLLVIIGIHLIEYFLNRTDIHRRRLYIIFSLLLGLLLASVFSYSLGNIENIRTQSGVSPMTGRYETRWAYGGGYGGGFHVADVLSVFIPPERNKRIPAWKDCGPDAYLTKIGFPLTTAKLQDGEYEGFSYMGTIAFGLLFLFVLLWGFSIIKNFRRFLMRIQLSRASKVFIAQELFSLPAIIGITTFLLYILSWGYIIHFGGARWNNVVTPSLLIAEYWPKFLWARSMGRLAVPFMLYLILAVVIGLDYYGFYWMQKIKRPQKVILSIIVVGLIFLHVYEIQGYLKPPDNVIRGNEIVSIFNVKDQQIVKKLLRNKTALMVAPYSMANIAWGKICYSLAFHGNVPLGGPTSTLNLILNKTHYEKDYHDILSGNIQGLVNRYGNIAIAVPRGLAEKVRKKTNLRLNEYKFLTQDCVIFTIAE